MPAATELQIDPAEHLGLVWFLARNFLGRGLDFDDLVGEGTVGLVKAWRTFDPDHGAPWPAYASKCICTEIRDALASQARPIRVPRWAYRAVKAGIKADSSTLSPFARQCITAAVRVLNSQAKWSEDEPKIDAIPERQPEEPPTLEGAGIHLDSLPPREATILRFHFGLDGQDETTLEVAGRALGMTRERARQLEAKAIRQLCASVGVERAPGIHRVTMRRVAGGAL